MKRVTSAFEKLHNYIKILALPSMLTHSEIHTICQQAQVSETDRISVLINAEFCIYSACFL